MLAAWPRAVRPELRRGRLRVREHQGVVGAAVSVAVATAPLTSSADTTSTDTSTASAASTDASATRAAATIATAYATAADAAASLATATTALASAPVAASTEAAATLATASNATPPLATSAVAVATAACAADRLPRQRRLGAARRPDRRLRVLCDRPGAHPRPVRRPADRGAVLRALRGLAV